MPSGHYGRGARGEKGVYRHPDCFNVTGDSDGANLATLGERLVYKYFPSLHAIYDALFARGNLRLTVYVEDAIRDCEPGLDSLLEGARASTRCATREVGLAPLLFFRPIP